MQTQFFSFSFLRKSALLVVNVSTLLSIMTSSANAYTVVIGLNPALQKRFLLARSNPNLVPGSVHRAHSIQQGIGGKGQDGKLS